MSSGGPEFKLLIVTEEEKEGVYYKMTGVKGRVFTWRSRKRLCPAHNERSRQG